MNNNDQSPTRRPRLNVEWRYDEESEPTENERSSSAAVATKSTSVLQTNLFDEHWDYPEIVAQLQPQIACESTRAEIVQLIENGDVDEILWWIDRVQPGQQVVKLLHQGIYWAPEWRRIRFDAETMGQISFYDTCGSVAYFCQRRVGKKFHFWMQWDGFIDHHFVSEHPMTRSWLQKTINEVLSLEITCGYEGSSIWGDKYSSPSKDGD